MSPPRPPVDYIARTKEQYSSLGYPIYRWVESESEPPWAAVRKRLAESRVGLVASGGIYAAGQIAFHWKDDISYREIDSGTEASELRITHFAYDVRDARSDPNVVFPLERLRELARDGVIGGVGKNAYSFMGGVYSARRVKEKLAPALTRRLIEDEVDLVLLVPV